ncbi:hypothetical protein L5849_06105 [Erythrobacter sp. SN021]|uniref:hypothetical protein n=1 Tax=Erythrobacter sp. SN021 TaxID=2912574 RepID=UPI001F1E3FF6|nr:hypothetical protein [Erythrobacter sp. SN021]MCF8882266.1 hypothetical protein [Erythrobacter sp. SN021]
MTGDQFSMFGDGKGRMEEQRQPDILPDPDRVRRRLHGILETARAAPDVPWPEKKQRVWRIVFPNMAKWLPDDEADQLCFEFAQEMERLGLAA